MGDHVVEFSRVSSNYILIFGWSFALLIRSFTSHTEFVITLPCVTLSLHNGTDHFKEPL